MKYDKELESRIAQAFETMGDALIHILSASRKDDWQSRHHAAQGFARATAGIYRAISEDGPPLEP